MEAQGRHSWFSASRTDEPTPNNGENKCHLKVKLPRLSRRKLPHPNRSQLTLHRLSPSASSWRRCTGILCSQLRVPSYSQGGMPAACQRQLDEPLWRSSYVRRGQGDGHLDQERQARRRAWL